MYDCCCCCYCCTPPYFFLKKVLKNSRSVKGFYVENAQKRFLSSAENGFYKGFKTLCENASKTLVLPFVKHQGRVGFKRGIFFIDFGTGPDLICNQNLVPIENRCSDIKIQS